MLSKRTSIASVWTICYNSLYHMPLIYKQWLFLILYITVNAMMFKKTSITNDWIINYNI